MCVCLVVVGVSVFVCMCAPLSVCVWVCDCVYTCECKASLEIPVLPSTLGGWLVKRSTALQ